MNLNDKIRLFPRSLKVDSRGWFLKAMTGTEQDRALCGGEIYLTMALPGQSRGNHYHPKGNEWFTVFQGICHACFVDVFSGERLEMSLSGDQPVTIYVPAGVGHVFVNPATQPDPLLLLAYADRVHDPADTIPLDIL